MEMSLYEYRDLIASQQALVLASLTFYVSLVSAYLAVAYLVGKKLTKFQARSLSVLFTLTALGSWQAVMNSSSVAVDLISEMDAAYGTGRSATDSPFLGFVIMGAIFFAGIVMALLFMWNVRRGRAS